MWRVILIGMGIFCGSLKAQNVLISRYIPGNYLADNRHRVELYNPGPSPVSLEGFLLVTRDYSVRLPASVSLQPRAVFVLAKRQAPGVNLALSETPDFLIRFHLLENEGNYILLFDQNMDPLEAMYFSPLPNVPFLPDRDTLITYSRVKIPYSVPPENRELWSYISIGEDPRNTFVKQDGEWKLSRNRSSLNPSTDYRALTTRYFDGIVMVKWTTSFEQNCQFHHVERSEDQERFTEVKNLNSQGDSQEFQNYSYYEKGLEEGKLYYYRIRSEDIYGNSVYSKIRGVRAEEGLDEFSLEAFVGLKSGNGVLNVRFTSLHSQRVRVKLFDENMREVAILFNDYVFAEKPNFLKISRTLSPGKYLILADTETRRFAKQIEIGKK
ncbi:MAG TPA: lamin tail domain-containing protein [Bacteroidetes bacterium]|nr:lamin tail domain-containing protein [Bacteroidota bacterium]